MLICQSCKTQKEPPCFEFRTDTGVFRKQCKPCRALQRKSRYENNKEQEKKASMARYFANHAAEKEKRKEYYQNNKEAHKIRMANWRAANPERNREITKEISRAQRKRPYYKFREMLRSLVRRIGETDKDLLGYTLEEFKSHIESLFASGMTWENHGEWEIDHIKPVVQFYREGVVDPKVVNALSNLQPLWKIDNRKKSSKYVDQ